MSVRHTGWSAFEHTAPDFAAAGRRLLTGKDGVAIGFLASVSAAQVLHLAPVCPIFCDGNLYLSAGGPTPKTNDLRGTQRYVLHALLGANDEEFQVAGQATEVHDASERADVHTAIRFGAFNRADPVFHLHVERALWVFWERVGQPDTKPIRRRWSARR